MINLQREIQRDREAKEELVNLKLVERFLEKEKEKNKRIKDGSVIKETVSKNVCVICIDDYKSDNLIREIKTCKHLFHVKCIDKWFEENHSCPECRISIMGIRQRVIPQ